MLGVGGGVEGRGGGSRRGGAGAGRAELPVTLFGLRPHPSTPELPARGLGWRFKWLARDPNQTRTPPETWLGWRLKATGAQGGPSSPKHGSGGDPKQPRTPRERVRVEVVSGQNSQRVGPGGGSRRPGLSGFGRRPKTSRRQQISSSSFFLRGSGWGVGNPMLDPWYQTRVGVQPGRSGLWCVNGFGFLGALATCFPWP